MNMTNELQESLLAACKAAGIEKPKYIAQDEDGEVWHYEYKPTTQFHIDMWVCANWLNKKLDHPPYDCFWTESLLEWVDENELERRKWGNVFLNKTANDKDDPLKLEVGKTYLTRNGKRVKVITSESGLYHGEIHKSDYDIISLAPDESETPELWAEKWAVNHNGITPDMMQKWRDSFDLTPQEQLQIDAHLQGEKSCAEKLAAIHKKATEALQTSAIYSGNRHVESVMRDIADLSEPNI